MAILLVPLEKHHDRENFNCGEDALNKFLKEVAVQHQSKNISRTIVAVDSESPETILGFHCITLAEIRDGEIPANLGKRLPNRIPVIRLGRLATDLKCQGNKALRIGETLLFDAMDSAKELSARGGGVALVVDAKHEKAASFYRKYDFIPFADNPLKLYIRVETIPG